VSLFKKKNKVILFSSKKGSKTDNSALQLKTNNYTQSTVFHKMLTETVRF